MHCTGQTSTHARSLVSMHASVMIATPAMTHGLPLGRHRHPNRIPCHRPRGGEMTDSLRGKAAIVGVADLASPTGELDLHGRALEIAVIKAALDDAGLTIGDVDGVCHALSSMALAEYLRITPRWTESTMTGGSSFEVHAEHAAAAIAA